MTNAKVLKVVSANKNVASRGAQAKQNCKDQLGKQQKQAIAFFVGGAGDKESYYTTGPYNNIAEAMDVFDPKMIDLTKKSLYLSYYLGYNEVRGFSNIKKNVVARIPSESSLIFIVGHSLGGWNGAHLSKILSDEDYKVEMLITLDPVGEGAMVWMGSNIHRERPAPRSGYWINILAKPNFPDGSDTVAEFGERWVVKNGPNINHVANVNHYNAKRLFYYPLPDGRTAADIMQDSIRNLVSI